MVKAGVIKAIATMPYSRGDRSLATSMTPTANIMVEGWVDPWAGKFGVKANNEVWFRRFKRGNATAKMAGITDSL